LKVQSKKIFEKNFKPTNWDFIGKEGTYEELLNCFERAGIELRPEIDAYFSKFK